MATSFDLDPAYGASAAHPPGLYYLSFTEVWERFSFYGMQALLVLYMVDQVLTPGHIETVAGMGGFRTALEGVFGPLSVQALSSQVFGLYTAFVYFTPLMGGWIGDQVLGRRTTVLIGAGLMALGHLLMAFEVTFLLALLMLILGSGCLKGNISAQVGDLYPRDDPRRTPAFSLFNLAINIGAFIAPLACGTLGELYGWHYGFGLAAAGMVVGAAIYWAGGRHLAPQAPVRRQARRPALTATDMPMMWALGAMLLLGTLYGVAYAQEFNVFNIWARAQTDRHILGFEMPVTWFPAFDGLFIVAFTPLVLRLWSAQRRRGIEESDLAKIGLGSALGAIGMLALVAASLIFADGGRPGVGWGVFCFLMFALGFIYTWPTTLALCSRNAPAALGGVIMGVAFLTNFVANSLCGWIGSYYERMTAANFWLLHAAITGVGAVLIFAFHRPLNRALCTPRPEG
ncbi:peptide MFS transporter [uncultured Phenylobacterium sp.]|uniref:peptide MFS transporter n=1 Tax=uncultured Phenylobacterium sp. TaxID=349273 RepID=UPI0026000670|nr:peptide MFS transporter [uncultured Phenylobacterium sp.]